MTTLITFWKVLLKKKFGTHGPTIVFMYNLFLCLREYVNEKILFKNSRAYCF